MRSPSNSIRVILIRHGRSTFNEQGLYQGSSNLSVLTEGGKQMAHRVGEFLKNEAVNVMYTSPLKRVLQTTDAVLSRMGTTYCLQQVKQHKALQEIDMHAWEGQTFKRVQESFAMEYTCWKERPHEFQMEILNPTVNLQMNLQVNSQVNHSRSALATVPQTHCFPVLDLFDRAQTFWQEILPQHLGQTITIVSHGGTNRALICTALGISPAQFHRMQQSNCGVSILTFPTGQLASARLETLNLTTQLGETLPKLKEGKQGLRLLLLSSDQATPETIQPLCTLLQSVDLNFCLTCASETSQAITEQVLLHHPTTIQMQSQRDRSLTTWQRTITTNTQHPTQLMTGLVIASIAEIQQMLGDLAGLNPSQSWRLDLKPGTLSILHYPSRNLSPVLQAMNFI